MAIQDDNVTLNLNTTTGHLIRAQNYGTGLGDIQVVRLEFGTSSESILSAGNPLPVTGTFTLSQPAPVNFSTSLLSSTQTNLSLANPGANFRVTMIGIMSAAYSATSGDNPSITIGIGTSTPATPFFLHPGIAPGTGYIINLTDIAAGTGSQQIWLTTGTFSHDTLYVFGTYHL